MEMQSTISASKYIGRNISRALNYIKENGIAKVVPYIDLSVGRVSYKELSVFSIEEQSAILSILQREGIASEEEDSSSVMQCGSCDGFKFLASYTCTFCKSANIEKGQVIRHLPCNNVDFDYKFQTLDGELLCDKCNTRLKAIGVDYSKQSNFFKCLNCDSMSPRLDIRYTCERCGRHSLEGDLELMKLPAYSIDLIRLEKFIRESDYVLSIIEELRALGIDALEMGLVMGRSNVPHHFAIVAYRGRRTQGVSAFHSGDPHVVAELVDRRAGVAGDKSSNSRTALLAVIAKFVDVAAQNKILLAIPRLDDDERSMAATYGIATIESDSISDAKAELVSHISHAMAEAEQLQQQQQQPAQPKEEEEEEEATAAAPHVTQPGVPASVQA
ncbi:MAG: hypothetical protein AB1753_03260 [Thermoproteota archaeon]